MEDDIAAATTHDRELNIAKLDNGRLLTILALGFDNMLCTDEFHLSLLDRFV